MEWLAFVDIAWYWLMLVGLLLRYEAWVAWVVGLIGCPLACLLGGVRCIRCTWVVGWMVDRLVGWLVGCWLVGWSVDHGMD